TVTFNDSHFVSCQSSLPRFGVAPRSSTADCLYVRTQKSARWILLTSLCSRIENLEAPVGPCREFQVICRIRSLRIGDEIRSNVVSRTTFVGIMELPKIFKAGRFLQNVPGRGCAAFFGAVVHDCHPRSDSVYEFGTAALIPAMMRNDI